jgi:hypothetical protein
MGVTSLGRIYVIRYQTMHGVVGGAIFSFGSADMRICQALIYLYLTYHIGSRLRTDVRYRIAPLRHISLQYNNVEKWLPEDEISLKSELWECSTRALTLRWQQYNAEEAGIRRHCIGSSAQSLFDCQIACVRRPEIVSMNSDWTFYKSAKMKLIYIEDFVCYPTPRSCQLHKDPLSIPICFRTPDS